MGQHEDRKSGAEPWENYWGKARPDEQQEVNWHPLVYHCLDVAAAGVELLRCDPRLVSSFERATGCAAGPLLPWLTFFLVLHDLGKFSVPFQQQVPELQEKLQGKKPEFSSSVRHDRLGFYLYQSRFGDWFFKKCGGLLSVGGRPIGPGTLDPWWMAVTGHHGRPPDGAVDFDIPLQFGSDGAAAAEHFAGEIFRLLSPGPLSLSSKEAIKTSSWLLAGLAVLADWLGSNQEFFKYRGFEPPGRLPLALPAYWEVAQEQARKAVEWAGLVPVASAPARTMGELFPKIKDPSPLQVLCAGLPLAPGPQIFIVEDATGAGKTEAALMLAHRLIEGGHADGLYVAMPTMATANGMFPRVAGVLPAMFAGPPSLVLAHSSARLAQQLQQQGASKVFDGAEGKTNNLAEEATDERGRGDTATRHATAWLSDSAKKALLAPVGVGTLDQALLAALPANHSPLRLLGLHRKVLIVDEVHACDVYMSKILDRLLAFHARLGGSAILLSATLAVEQRQRLLDAFLGAAGDSTVELRDYPSLAHGSQGATCVHPVRSSSRSERDVGVEWLTDAAQVRGFLLDSAARGGCGAWVKNTVTDAIEACGRLRCEARARGEQVEVLLFHARFALGDRLEIEEQVLRRFGPESTPEDRARTLLVATQVIEQSLDLDFDAMVSDLAPVDLLIQRAGRLRRHPRATSGARVEGPDQRGRPCLRVFSPPWSDDPEPSWLTSSELRRTAMVYPAQAHLWRTMRAIRARGALRIPVDARALVEAVYGADAPTPPGMETPQLAYEGKELARESAASVVALRPELGYCHSANGGWQDDTIARTRLGEATSRVRLAVDEAGELRPLISAPGQPPWVAWALSEVSVRADLISAEFPGDASLIEAAKKRMSDQGRFVVLLVLRPVGGGLVGHALGQRRGTPRLMKISYDRQLGLEAAEMKGT